MYLSCAQVKVMLFRVAAQANDKSDLARFIGEELDDYWRYGSQLAADIAAAVIADSFDASVDGRLKPDGTFALRPSLLRDLFADHKMNASQEFLVEALGLLDESVATVLDPVAGIVKLHAELHVSPRG